MLDMNKKNRSNNPYPLQKNLRKLFDTFSNVSFTVHFDACREKNKWIERFKEIKAVPESFKMHNNIIHDIYDEETKASYKDHFDPVNPVNHFFLLNFSCPPGGLTDADSLYSGCYIKFCQERMSSPEGCVKLPYHFDVYPHFKYRNHGPPPSLNDFSIDWKLKEAARIFIKIST